MATRRQFIKRGFGAAVVSFVMPPFSLRESLGQQASPDPNRRILVIIELAGGNDGLNTLAPFSDPRYRSLRPKLALKEQDLKDAQGNSTIISNDFGLHPAMAKIKEMYDSSRAAIIRGVGYPAASLSHFLSMDIWHTANVDSGTGDGWLGKYADIALVGQPLAGISINNSVTIGPAVPKTFLASKVIIPNIRSFATYGFDTDSWYPANRANQVRAFTELNTRSFPEESPIASAAHLAVQAIEGATRISNAPAAYRSTVTYPANNPLADGLKMAAQIATATPVTLVYLQLGGFDLHGHQIASEAENLTGLHAGLLGMFSEGVKAFYDDMAEHGLADNVLILQTSEFGRRPQENSSLGTDHGTASPIFVFGNAVRGGLYGEQPSLASTALDSAGNMQFTMDFRAVYATVLDKWLLTDSQAILGGKFENVGFLG